MMGAEEMDAEAVAGVAVDNKLPTCWIAKQRKKKLIRRTSRHRQAGGSGIGRRDCFIC